MSGPRLLFKNYLEMMLTESLADGGFHLMDDEDGESFMGYTEDTVFPNPDAPSGDEDEFYRTVVMSNLRDLQSRPDDEAFLDSVIRLVEMWIDYTKETVHTMGFNEGYELAEQRFKHRH